MVCCPTSARFAPTVQTASFDQHSLWSWTRNEDLLWESRSTPKGRALLASKLRTSCIGCYISGSSTRFESVFKLVFYSNWWAYNSHKFFDMNWDWWSQTYCLLFYDTQVDIWILWCPRSSALWLEAEVVMVIEDLISPKRQLSELPAQRDVWAN